MWTISESLESKIIELKSLLEYNAHIVIFKNFSESEKTNYINSNDAILFHPSCVVLENKDNIVERIICFVNEKIKRYKYSDETLDMLCRLYFKM